MLNLTKSNVGHNHHLFTTTTILLLVVAFDGSWGTHQHKQVLLAWQRQPPFPPASVLVVSSSDASCSANDFLVSPSLEASDAVVVVDGGGGIETEELQIDEH